jgi:alkyl sulfatase BDS1-like metallo-beta-lactamase superfamily hydrolase
VPDDLFDLVDRLWNGTVSTVDRHPVIQSMSLAELGEGCAFLPSFGNVSVFSTEAGLVLVDTGSQFLARTVHSEIRRWDRQFLHSAIFSHGHIDHVFGVGVFEEEAIEKGWPAPRVIAHEALPLRFDRYVATAGYNAVINRRQFGLDSLTWPTDFRYPDETYSDFFTFEVGGEAFELHHARGETDDHTWTWVPSKRAVCCGDLFIWASPNAGNPQKVQRYPADWAKALREIASLSPELLLPGHGLPIVGSSRVTQALSETAEYLESLVSQTLTLMNEGADLDTVIHSVRAPEHLAGRPYLQPVYDEPEFIVRNIWRLYGGWFDGDPSTLKPAPAQLLAREIAQLAGGAGRLCERALTLAEEGNLRLACHLVEFASRAKPEDGAIHEARAHIYALRAERETSTMAKGIFGWAARESSARGSRPSTNTASEVDMGG